jgi:oligosaccharide repeat unit polymerase
VRVALLCQHIPPVEDHAGQEALELAKGLRARGMQVEVIAENRTLAPPRATVDGVRVRRMRGEGAIQQLPVRVAGVVRTLAFIAWAVLRLVRRRYDVIQVYGCDWFAWGAVLAAHVRKTPILVKVTQPGVHDAETLSRRCVGPFRVDRLASAPLRSATAVLAPDPEAAACQARYFPHVPVGCLPGGVDGAQAELYAGLYMALTARDDSGRATALRTYLSAHSESSKRETPGHDGDGKNVGPVGDDEAPEPEMRGEDAPDDGPGASPEPRRERAITTRPLIRGPGAAPSSGLVAARAGNAMAVRTRLHVSGDVVAIIGAVLGAVLLGALGGLADLGGKLSHPETAAEYALIGCGVFGVIALRSENRFALKKTGPGVHVAALALAFTFFVGVYVVAPYLRPKQVETIVLMSVSVAAFVVGALVTAPTFLVRATLLQSNDAPPITRQRIVLWIAAIFALAAFVNLATGSVPLLSGNINGTRFGGTGAVLHLGAWIDGGLEWSAVVAGAAIVRQKRVDKWSGGLTFVGVVPLILLGGRSFLLIVALSVLVVIASMHRVSFVRLALTIVLGIAVLGAAGQYRSLHSFEGANAHKLSLLGTIFKSAGIGPSVFSSVLERVPAEIPYQHGGFLTRDFRAVLPLHPLGRPLASDYWVTQAVRQRNTSLIGGSPPTLAGGLYIDFGIPGIIFGAAVLGAMLVLLYRWVLDVGTIGALVLYAYFAAYVALAAYAYISLKPTMVTVMILAYLLHRVELRKQGPSLVPEVS